MSSIEEYRNGGEGFARWAEENLWVKIFPMGEVNSVWIPLKDMPKDEDEYGRSYWNMWEAQKEICNRALVMENGRFKHALIVFCWPRGEGKSLLACFIQLWKFFCWPNQQIMLGANSKDQVKFVHFDIMRDLIHHSPNLVRAIGDERNIQEKEIRLRDGSDNVASIIRSISSFTGIVSNISGYTFSEMFDMKNPTFFVQIDGSIRNIPNAMGVIDSTVSSKQHVLYSLFENNDKVENLFFSYRFSKDGHPGDYWNPNMSQTQLDAYRIKFPLGQFEQYFLNLWSAGSEKVFSEELIEAMNYLGVDNRIHMQKELVELLGKRNKIRQMVADLESKDLEGEIDNASEIHEIERRFWPVESVYTLRTPQNQPTMATMGDLERLGDLYDTDWVVTGGIDRADPMKRRTTARTIFSLLAKGLPGSRSKPYMYAEEGAVPNFLYVMLHLANVEDHSLESLKTIINSAHLEFDGIDLITGERWGIWDLAAWCEEIDIRFEPVYPTYDRQKAAFSEFFITVRDGRFKTPSIVVPGSKGGDILKEEAGIFDHDPDKKWFGSVEKSQKYGVQDDSMYSIGWNLYGARELVIDDFRPRKTKGFFGLFVEPSGLITGRMH